jgi:hypothetical protein
MASREDSPSDEDLSVAESIADAAWEVGGTCAYTAASIWEMFRVDKNDLDAQTRGRIERALSGEGVRVKPRLSGRRIRPKRIITVRLDDDAMGLRKDSATQQAEALRVSGPPVTHTFKKRAYWFDAPGLRDAIEQDARALDVQLSVLSETRKLLTVTMEFSATGSAEAIDDFREAIRPNYMKAVGEGGTSGL